MTDRSRLDTGAAARATWFNTIPPVLVATALGLALVGAAWLVRSYSLPEPAVAVQRVLELRRDRSTDASAYAPFFTDASVARTLASQAKGTTRSSVPEWDRPYVSRLATSSADIVVVWRRDSPFAEWPTASVFRLRRSDGRWRIVDASVVATGDAPPKPRR